MEACEIASRGSITENTKSQSEASEAFREDELEANILKFVPIILSYVICCKLHFDVNNYTPTSNLTRSIERKRCILLNCLHVNRYG